MKAIIQEKYGPSNQVLQYKDFDQPRAGDREVVVKVKAASVHPDVWHVVTGRPFILRLMGAGFWKPKDKIPGTEVAGVVESVGSHVTRFKKGDEVFGECLPGMQWKNGGSFAEYVAVKEDFLVFKPQNITFEQAATISTAGMIVLLNLQNLNIQPGQKVLINGAGGNVGSVALQILKAWGTEVTGVECAAKQKLLLEMGADKVIDYAKSDFTESKERYDLVFDVASNLDFLKVLKVLTPKGVYVFIGHDHFGQFGRSIFGSIPHFLKLFLISFFYGHLPKMSAKMPSKQETMSILSKLIESGKLRVVIDRVFPLSQAVQALAYLESGVAKGRIVIVPDEKI